jgi:hypothetical protein
MGKGTVKQKFKLIPIWFWLVRVRGIHPYFIKESITFEAPIRKHLLNEKE